MLKTPHWLLAGCAGAGKALCVCLGVLVGASGPASAHPHSCVAMDTTVLYDKGAFTGLQLQWTFDESYTQMAVEGQDKNKDGKYDRSELAELAQVNMEALKEVDYFTVAAIAGQPVKLGEAKDYWFDHKDGILSLHFTLPFAAPVPVEDKTLALAVQDPSNMVAFGLPRAGQAVHLAGNAPKGCRLKVEMPDKDEQAVTNQLLDALGCAIAIPRAVTVACNAP